MVQFFSAGKENRHLVLVTPEWAETAAKTMSYLSVTALRDIIRCTFPIIFASDLCAFAVPDPSKQSPVTSPSPDHHFPGSYPEWPSTENNLAISEAPLCLPKSYRISTEKQLLFSRGFVKSQPLLVLLKISATSGNSRLAQQAPECNQEERGGKSQRLPRDLPGSHLYTT